MPLIGALEGRSRGRMFRPGTKHAHDGNRRRRVVEFTGKSMIRVCPAPDTRSATGRRL